MPKLRPPPERPPFVVKESYTVPELAAYAGVHPDTMRRRLRELGFEPPGRRRTERILFSTLRSLAPALVDSFRLASLSAREAEAVRRRLDGGPA